MKEKFGIVLGILVFFICFGVFLFYMENYQGIYYTKIDNREVSTLETTGDMKYQYKLVSYNNHGLKKTISFKTRRKLKEGSFIKLVVKFMGVHSWEEVSYEELPEKIQKYFEK